MLKIFAPKVVDKVNVGYIGDIKISKEINQAKGVMNNYLRDKHFSVEISRSLEKESSPILVRGISEAKKSPSSCMVPIKSDDKEPLLRKIYRTIEMFAKDPTINTKK